MDFLNKLTEATKSAADKANNMLEINRLNSKIHLEEKAIGELVQKIGEYYVAKMDDGLEAFEETADLYQEIQETRRRIKALQNNVQRLRNENERPSQKIKCDFCGNLNPSGRKFCGECGSRLGEEKELCAVCGAELIEGLKFCGECGAKIE